ncbi:MAG: VOC family protein [Bacteroidetes bacterium]|nr:MAG: VOC family protein [Bacteroidota bacterium]
MKKIAAVILTNPAGELLLYLRDNKPGLPFPHHWDLFGGHVEPGETVEAALLREVREELGIELSAYRFFRKYEVRGDEEATPNDKYIFHAEIDQPQQALTLYEGERLHYFRPEEIGSLRFANILGRVVADFLREYDPARPPALRPQGVHHIAIIASDYARSRAFYTQVLGCTLLQETYREARQSWKGDLAIAGQYQIELFSFPGAPPRPSYPEAQGLRHLALAVADIEEGVAQVKAHGVTVEPIRVDEGTGKRFAFFADPDGLPIELYEG